MKKLTKMQKGIAILIIYALAIIVLGHFNSRMSPYYAVTAIAALAVAIVEGILFLISKAMGKNGQATFKTVTIFASIIAVINVIAVLTTSI